MNTSERREFMAAWAEVARPRIRACLHELAPDAEVDGVPASPEDVAVALRTLFSDESSFERYWGESVPAHLRLTDEEKAAAREVILTILDDELARHSH